MGYPQIHVLSSISHENTDELSTMFIQSSSNHSHSYDLTSIETAFYHHFTLIFPPGVCPILDAEIA